MTEVQEFRRFLATQRKGFALSDAALGHALKVAKDERTGGKRLTDEPTWLECLAVMPKGKPNVLPSFCGNVGDCFVWLVDGNRVKVENSMEFVSAANDAELKDLHGVSYIPDGTIWVDGKDDPSEWPFNCYHEAVERRLIAENGLSYDEAHELANEAELEKRKMTVFKSYAKAESLDDSEVEKGIGDTLQLAGRFLAEKWASLEERYGRKTALAMAAASLATLPLPFSVPAIVAAAEAYRGLQGHRTRELSSSVRKASGQPTVAVDFDGTLTGTPSHADLDSVEPREGSKEALEKFRGAGLRIALWTARTDIDDVERWMQQYGMPYDTVNENPDQRSGTRKLDVDVFVDDKAVNAAERDWSEIANDVMTLLHGKVRQPVDEDAGYEGLMTLSEKALPELKTLLDALKFPTISLDGLELGEFEAKLRTKGGLVVLPPVKTEKRAAEKVESDYGGDWSKLLDVVRASVAVDAMDDLKEAVGRLRDAGAVTVRLPKDRFKEPLGNGYRDYLVNYKLPCGMICEVQFHLKPMLIARERSAALYDVVRAIKAAMKEEGRSDMTPAESEAVRRAKKNSERVFARAWEEINGGSEVREVKSLGSAEAARQQFQRILDGIDDGKVTTQTIRAYAEELRTLPKSELDKLLPLVNVAGRASSKRDAIERLTQVLQSQYEMWGKTRFAATNAVVKGGPVDRLKHLKKPLRNGKSKRIKA